MNNNSRNGYSDVPNQSNRYGSRTGSSGWRLPAFPLQNPWSRSDLIVNRRFPDNSPSAYSRTAISSTADSVPASPTPHQVPVRTSNNVRRQHLEALRQAVHNQHDRPERNSRSASSQAREEDDVLKYLTKETYNPVPKSQLLRSLSFYYKNKNSGSESSRIPQGYTGGEDEKRCAVCLEDFEPKETVMLTPCKHMFHEECIVPWLKSKGQCPVCRFVILTPKRRDPSPGSSPDLAGDITVNDLFTLELISVIRAMEETFLFGYPRRR